MLIIDGAPTIRLAAGACGLLMLSEAGMAATLANPAAVLCAKNGATIVIETAENGAQRGVCVFPDGTRIDEWTYFRNKHRSSGSLPAPAAGDAPVVRP